MADIKDCASQHIKISKSSITIKNGEGKTCGVVRNTCSLRDLQPNKQFDFFSQIKKLGLWGQVDCSKCIISDNTLYVFRNIEGKLFREKHGFFDDYEKETAAREELVYETLINGGIQVIEYLPA